MDIILVIGLPGSGKSHFLKSFSTDLYNICDDIKTLDDLPNPKENKNLVIACPTFCFPRVLISATNYLGLRYLGSQIKYFCFENNPEKCLKNIEYRNDGRMVKEAIFIMSKFYEIPENSTILPIWQPEKPADLSQVEYNDPPPDLRLRFLFWLLILFNFVSLYYIIKLIKYLYFLYERS